jgi:hypothetical protein
MLSFPRVFGRIYLGTGGRRILVGEPRETRAGAERQN